MPFALLSVLVVPWLEGCLSEADPEPGVDVAFWYPPDSPDCHMDATEPTAKWARIGVEGGEIRLCGARLVVAPGQLDRPVVLSLWAWFEGNIIGVPDAPGHKLPSARFTVNVDPDLGAAEPRVIGSDLWLELPTAGPNVDFFHFDVGGPVWDLLRDAATGYVVEPVCRDHGGLIGQYVSVPGTFSAQGVLGAVPPGSGAGSLVLGDTTFDVGPRGHAVMLDDGLGNRRVQINPANDDRSPTLTFEIAADGTAEVIRFLSFHGDATHPNQWTDRCDHPWRESTATLSLEPGTGSGRYVGSYTVRCARSFGDLGYLDVHGSFDVTPVPANVPARTCEPLERPNLAFLKPATQSSTNSDYASAKRAVDGNTDGRYSSHSVSQTTAEARAWWQVDLGRVTDIGEIVLHNRTDCCGDQLANFEVQVSDDGASWRVVATHPGPAGAQTRLAVDASTRFVRVQLLGTGPLSLAEVEVLAPNLAAGKAATQSSTPSWGGQASRAVDGNVDGVWTHNSVTQTDQEAKPWWQVDLGKISDIGEVVIHNRTDASSEQLADFDVQVSNDGASWRVVAAVTGKAAARTRLAIDAAARYVRVQLRGTGYLSLAEVQVLAPRNLAAGKVTTQSSTPSWGGPAARAVDGNLDGAWAHQSVTHTDREPQAWWQVDLGAVMPVGKIVLHNRTDCCAERLADFDVLVSADAVNWTRVAAYGGVAGPRTALSLETEARFVRVQLRGTDYLSLAEVQLFAPKNLARGKTASQSSTASSTSGAGNAVDGDVAVLHPSADTGGEAAPWWQVDLGEVMEFATIAVTPGPGGLSDFTVKVSSDGLTWVEHGGWPGALTHRATFLVAAAGRYVRIERLPQPGSVLGMSLAEVEVLPRQNVALGKRAIQSSTPTWAGGASLAVDGNPDGAWTNGTMSSTAWQASPWWQVDLGPNTFNGTVVLHNRTDCCSERLANFVLERSSDGTTWWPVASHPGVAGPTARFVVGIVDRYLRVRLLGSEYLSLAEVEVLY